MNKYSFIFNLSLFKSSKTFTLSLFNSLLNYPMQPQPSNPPITSNNFSSSWQQNKTKMLHILKTAPVAGIYQNQPHSHWDAFFQFYLTFLNSQTGPRGQCARKIRKQLQTFKQQVDQALQPYKLNHTMHIRSLYVRFKYFVPCHEYHLHQTTSQTLAKSQQSLLRIRQPDHPMYKSIVEGMLKKRGPDFPYKEEIQKIQQNYQKRIERLKIDKLELEDKLSQMKEYQDWTRLNAVMKKWFDQWAQADSGMGKDSCSRGEIFETKVLNTVIPYIMLKQREGVLSHIKDDSLFTPESIKALITQATQPTSKKSKLPPFQILLNMKWQPRSLGEIDIALVEYHPQKQQYFALILIECKARLFDIREASYQVFPQYLKRDNKTTLSGKHGPVYLSDNFASYIVTTLPEFDFVLPIESQLKACLDRITKDLPIQAISQQKTKQALFNECTKRFANELSPLEWFSLNDSDRIIVLSSDNS